MGRKAQMVMPPWHTEICCRPERQQLRLEKCPLTATVSPPPQGERLREQTVGVACEAPPVAEEANRVRRSRRLYARRMPQRKDADGKRERSAKGRAALVH